MGSALRRPGRYQAVRDNLEIKEIVVGDSETRIRYILVRTSEDTCASEDVALGYKQLIEVEDAFRCGVGAQHDRGRVAGRQADEE